MKRFYINKTITPIIALIVICSIAFSAIIIAPYANFANSALFFTTLLNAPSPALKAVMQSAQQSEESNDSIAVQNPVSGAPEENSYIQETENTGENTEETALSEQESANSEIPQQEPNIEYSTQAPTPVQQNPQGTIPEGSVAIVSKMFTSPEGNYYIRTGNASIQNFTQLPDSFIQGYVGSALPFSIQLNSDEPQVLIMHTHGTETYETENEYYTNANFTARSTNSDINVLSIGAIIAQNLNESGITTLHDTSLHDYPSYNGSYERSHETVSEYLKQYPSIKVVIDVHRDALQEADGTRIKPLALINGQNTAQVMLICGADLNGNLPNYTENLKFASAWQAQMEGQFPGLTRPVLFDYRYYNQDLTTGSLLLEVGGHANTLAEAQRAANLAAIALANTLLSG